MTKSVVYRPKPISGYPEWLPEVRMQELRWLAALQETFESYGFAPIETPAVEELEVLASKGETADKEIYCIRRLNEENLGKTSDSGGRLGLHYDLTVPLARYVAQHFGDLSFPFKRHQCQKVWRGERPQEGRFREFYQCDIDVVCLDSLPLSYDVEVPLVMADALSRLPIGEFSVRLSNRKVLQGIIEGLQISESVQTIRLIDKIDKIGVEKLASLLKSELGISADNIEKIIAVSQIKTKDSSFVSQVEAIGVSSALLEQGLSELDSVSKELFASKYSNFEVDLSIARGFDYYTGTVLEAQLDQFPEFSSIAAGGRYDELASSYTNHRLPGIGISIGLSRLFSKFVAEGSIPRSRQTPTSILVTVPDQSSLNESKKIANLLRGKKIPTECYPAADKIKKQIKYADKKGIPFVLFPGSSLEKLEIKNMLTGEQSSMPLSSINQEFVKAVEAKS